MITGTSQRRLSRAESKARTRGMLLEAAAGTFARRGFAAATVEEIAEAAGFSVGALYSNFAGKQEIFLELCATYYADHVARASEILVDRHMGNKERISAIGRIPLVTADKDPRFGLLKSEFWLYAARNPTALESMAGHMRIPLTALEHVVADVLADDAGKTSAESPQRVTAVVAALFDGLVRQRQIDPDQVPEELFGQALRWLFAGLDAARTAWPDADRPAAETTLTSG